MSFADALNSSPNPKKPKINAHMDESGTITFDGLVGPATDEEPDLSPIYEAMGVDPNTMGYRILGKLSFSAWQQSKRTEDGDRDVVWLRAYKGTLVPKTGALTADEFQAILDHPNYSTPKTTVSKEASDFYRVTIVGDLQAGKALSDDTPVLTTRGWVSHGDLLPGMNVYGPDGQPKEVKAVTGSTDQDLYEVMLQDGTALVASGDHLWTGTRRMHPKGYKNGGPTWENREMTLSTLEVLDLMEQSAYMVRPFQIIASEPLSLEPKDLPIDPYVLGLWLGDGNSTSGHITMGEQDKNHLITYGHEVPSNSTRGFFGISVPGLKKKLKENGLLRNKHIPRDYLYASVEQRLALVQGLMDTDGSCCEKGALEFSNTNKDLVDGMVFLLQGLGMRPKVTEGVGKLNGKQYKPFWRLSWRSGDLPMFRFTRKLERQRPSTERVNMRRTVVSITPVGVGSAQCISVEGGLYLAGKQLTVTHNCDLNGGSKALALRVNEANARLAQIYEEEPADTLLYLDPGDAIEGFNSAPAQKHMNDMSLPAQLEFSRRALTSLLLNGKPFFEHTHVATCTSNHSAWRDGAAYLGKPGDDFGIDIHRAVQEAFSLADLPVTWHMPDPWKEYTVLTLDGVTIALTHGHRAKSEQRMMEWWKGQVFADPEVLGDVNIFVNGHWHHPHATVVGPGQWRIQSFSMDGGSSWFTNQTGEGSYPGLVTFRINKNTSEVRDLHFVEVLCDPL